MARAEQAVCARRAADRVRNADPGRRRGCDVDRGRRADRRRPGMRVPSTTCGPSSAWCRCSAASPCRSESSRSPACPAGSPASSTGRPCSCIGLIVPAISVLGVLLIRSETAERRPIDWRILGGGLAFGAVVIALGLGAVPFAQEMVFVLSMTVICTMLVLVTRELDPAKRGARSCSPASSSSRSAPRPRSATAISGGRSMC